MHIFFLPKNVLLVRLVQVYTLFGDLHMIKKNLAHRRKHKNDENRTCQDISVSQGFTGRNILRLIRINH